LLSLCIFHFRGEEFRPAFRQLGDLTVLFPGAAHLALTATATPCRVKQLAEILQFKDYKLVTCNPDRPNICIELKSKLPSAYTMEKYDELITPLMKELMLLRANFPVTFVYVESLQQLSYFYSFLANHLKESQYDPIDDKRPENRIFAQFHKDYTKPMKSYIIQDLQKREPKIRLVRATVALGMGLNAPSVQRVIHCRPPCKLENYIQEIGRAGRNGQQATAIMFYNNSDLANNRKGLSKDMVEFCRNSIGCLREHIVKFLGFNAPLYNGPPTLCCSNCAQNTVQTPPESTPPESTQPVSITLNDLFLSN
jgi:ATP-dependent DNA helicase RecQ